MGLTAEQRMIEMAAYLRAWARPLDSDRRIKAWHLAQELDALATWPDEPEDPPSST